MGKKRKRSDQHVADVEALGKKHPGGCLNAHHAKYSQGNTCSYRWQAYQKAVSDAGVYQWPSDYGLQPPKPKAWDVEQGTNFQDKSTIPYWHESHHIVPHAELNSALREVGDESPNAPEITLMIRGGLLDEGYKLNDSANMVILPMLSLHARAIGLPKHRMTPETFHHAEYSRIVLRKLWEIFAPLKGKVDPEKHEVPDYASVAKGLNALSRSLYPRIKSAGQLMKAGKMKGDSLSDIPADHLVPPR